MLFHFDAACTEVGEVLVFLVRLFPRLEVLGPGIANDDGRDHREVSGYIQQMGKKGYGLAIEDRCRSDSLT